MNFCILIVSWKKRNLKIVRHLYACIKRRWYYAEAIYYTSRYVNHCLGRCRSHLVSCLNNATIAYEHLGNTLSDYHVIYIFLHPTRTNQTTNRWWQDLSVWIIITISLRHAYIQKCGNSLLARATNAVL